MGQRDDSLTRGQLLHRTARFGAALVLGRSGLNVDAALAAAAPRTQAFHSRPDLHPPAIEVLRRATGTAPGYLLLSPSSGPGQRGVMAIDDGGDLVWFRPTSPHSAMNLRLAEYRGKPVLTWWQGKFKAGTGNGECVIVDGSYREVARFRASNGLPVDLHEFLITRENTALVTSNEVRTLDVTSAGGKGRHRVQGGVVLELEIPTGRVLWEWRSLDHIPLGESYQKIGPVFDYFHINSIDVAPDGNLVVSARNTWAAYKIDRRSGRVIWRLGGKRSDFSMGPGTRFAWQHDVRLHDGGSTVTVFDDGAAPPVEPRSRALVLSLDTSRMRASLARRYVHTNLLAKYTGSAQLLGDGDMLVGWGSEPNFTEFARDGAIRFDARLPHGGQTYRVVRFPWTGRPAESPRAVVRGSTAYASWNGATEVAAWQLRTGTTTRSLQAGARVPRHTFETALAVPHASHVAVAVALDRTGTELGRTAPFRI